MRYHALLILALLVVCSTFVLAEGVQPTQQFSKIYLTPFYRETMSSNTNYSYTVTVNPPDGLSKVVNAIVSFNAQVNGQTQTLTLWVNNKACNNPQYVVATAYSTTGNVQVYFDCSNIITAPGTYTIIMRSAVNTGAFTGWLDLTYTNNPLGKMDIFGTEYYQDDDGTLFLSLKDSNGISIPNATCEVTIYYPNLPNQQHPVWIQNGQMQYKENGLYYYDFTAPALSGLYMTNAQCIYSVQHTLYYTSASGKTSKRTAITGTYTGDTFTLNEYTDWLYTQCDSATIGGSKTCDSFYEWTVDANITDLYVNYMGENTLSATLTLYGWNWSSSAWVALPNTLTFHATATSSVPSGVDEYVSNKIPDLSHFIATNLSVRIRTATTGGSTFKIFTNWLQLDASKSSTIVQELKGSGEIHVASITPSEISGRFYTIQTCNGRNDGRCGFFTNDGEFDVPEGEIEDYMNVTAVNTKNGQQLTYYTPFSVDCTALDWIRKYNNTSATWSDFTDYEVYSQPALENCLIQLNIDLQAGEQYDFWFKMDNYMKWEVDFTKQIADRINSSVWTLCAGRNFTYTNPITESTVLPSEPTTLFCYYALDDMYYVNMYYDDSLGVGLAGEYASYVEEMRFYRSVLYDRYMYLALESNTTMIPRDVWRHSPRTLTYYPTTSTSNLTASDVWAYGTRNLTWFPAENELTAKLVWDYSQRNLTYYQMPTFPTYSNLTANEVWTYGTRALTNYAETTIASAIWTAADRNLTYYSYTNPSGDVWSYASRNLTWFPPYQNPATDVWTYAFRNLTYYAYTNPAGDVWTYADRNLTHYPSGVSAVDVWNYTARYIHGEII